MRVGLRNVNIASGRVVSVIPTAATRGLLLIYIYLREMVFRKEVSARESIKRLDDKPPKKVGIRQPRHIIRSIDKPKAIGLLLCLSL